MKIINKESMKRTCDAVCFKVWMQKLGQASLDFPHFVFESNKIFNDVFTFIFLTSKHDQRTDSF